MISIHTPAKGVTNNKFIYLRRWRISIHTPAKGVTDMIHGNRHDVDNFNPHSREGSDESGGEKKGDGFIFQSTLPRRE